MKNKLLLLLILAGCPLPKQQTPPTPIPSPTATIGAPPTTSVTPANRSCNSGVPVEPCKPNLKDGPGGFVFGESKTKKGQYFYIEASKCEIQPSMSVCTKSRCQDLPFDGCHNPEETREGKRLRPHYKGFLNKLDMTKPVKIKNVRVPNNKRSD